ncbi:hypothetical protein [Photobacterium sanguinicancri]|uniref:hypothetical protein n=1 Tax=Photobacterium sanguinicancri TaxID=875932 RepID=UPI0026E2D395|nr:hypothetical protein [Photobacterium sanguinicancri]MDO6500509.1 hypothetical protein [Photobacterium sanguinicancri]
MTWFYKQKTEFVQDFSEYGEEIGIYCSQARGTSNVLSLRSSEPCSRVIQPISNHKFRQKSRLNFSGFFKCGGAHWGWQIWYKIFSYSLKRKKGANKLAPFSNMAER